MGTTKKALTHVFILLTIVACMGVIFYKFRSPYVIVLGVIAVLLYILCSRYTDTACKIVDFIIKYRYAFGAAAVLVCTLLSISGSSNSFYDYFLNDSDGMGTQVLFGTARPIRSDEWAVQTPYYISQVQNGFQLLNPFIQSGAGQNMLIGYNAPVLDITLVAKPATWGYFLFGAERGLAFYWSFKQIFLAIFLFDICMLITRKAKWLALVGAFWIAFSPAVQWWFSPHFVDVVFWAMALVLVVYNFFMAKCKWWRTFYTILTVLVVCGFVFALFPSFQVAFGLLAVALIIVLLVRDKAKITFAKKQIPFLLAAALGIVALGGWWLYSCRDALSLLNNTAYPGDRIALGGGGKPADMFTDLTTFFLPYKDITYMNNSEVSGFIHFAPALLVLLPLFKKHRVDNMKVGFTLAGALGVCYLWMFVRFPEWLARTTLFSYINRMPYVCGFVSVLFCVWAIGVLARHPQIVKGWAKLLILALFAAINFAFIGSDKLGYLPVYFYIAAIAVMTLTLTFILYGNKKLIAACIIGITVVTGCTVNPISRGIGSMTNKVVVNEAKQLAQAEPAAYFMVDDEMFAIPNLLAANGIKTVGATSFYPDMDRWRLLDPDGAYEDIYNRYANMTVVLTDGETEFEQTSPDSMKIYLSYDDLGKLGIRYILSHRALDEVDAGVVKFQKVFDSENDADIYAVTYPQ